MGPQLIRPSFPPNRIVREGQIPPFKLRDLPPSLRREVYSIFFAAGWRIAAALVVLHFLIKFW